MSETKKFYNELSGKYIYINTDSAKAQINDIKAQIKQLEYILFDHDKQNTLMSMKVTAEYINELTASLKDYINKKINENSF